MTDTAMIERLESRVESFMVPRTGIESRASIGFAGNSGG